MVGVFGKEVKFETLIRTSETVSRRGYASTDFRIVYINQGEADWKIADRFFPIKPGSLALLSRSLERIISNITTECIDLWIINLSPQFVFNCGFTELFESIPERFSPIIPACGPDVEALFKTIEREYTAGQSQNFVIITAAAMMILALLSRERGIEAEPKIVAPKMKKVLDYIDENYTSQIYLSRLSEMAAMTSEAFSRYFKKINGINVFRYIAHKRTARAIDLLETTDRTVLDIALSCGFNNMANFYKTYHNLTGQKPSDLRIQKSIPNSQKS